MNQRILVLAQQAKLHSVLMLYHWKSVGALTDIEQQELENIEKFAESLIREQNGFCGLVWTEEDKKEFAQLIVQECAGMLETNGNAQRTLMFMEPGPHSKSADWLEGYREAATLYGSFLLKDNARRIKKHFGVNE